ncbi:MAG: HEPN domain-containing protein [Candidatus Acididesulfobacter diazotrophicus]|jgi:hypothetical protein|uniref:HEPN domain-containing protein n=1 Tax=Candidatus Acididesulfobacter diazotrophicus TaxID=2597226 RepID=A0A519BPR5_9DELT|nr:MAG: HEPN domain-containing protein [Candidatus Acididesulfobacter diazotrophicus]
MKQEIIDYAKFQLEKSKNTLKDAELLYENDRLTSAVNRIYYAIFYSVTAIMSLYGLSTSKHSGMLSNFNKEIANRGLINRELKDFYYDGQNPVSLDMGRFRCLINGRKEITKYISLIIKM